MGAESKFTQEEKQAISEAYKDRSKSVAEIAKEYGVVRSTVLRIAFEMGAEPRREKACKKSKYKLGKTCPKCHKKIDIKGALYCCFCGADIRSEKELLIDRINSAMRKTILCPEAIRDEMQRLFVDIKTELSKEVPG